MNFPGSRRPLPSGAGLLPSLISRYRITSATMVSRTSVTMASVAVTNDQKESRSFLVGVLDCGVQRGGSVGNNLFTFGKLRLDVLAITASIGSGPDMHCEPRRLHPSGISESHQRIVTP